ncbi:MAG: NAD-dependent epimerase/dehydratase family protein [Clostridium sp.]|uniref:NAD-dependent epimerase/dehydratase family protein n=1 Tax=Clostridium sp. TaxID=1506 RepID=UPI002A74B7F0|nr:NAD-dependent epimerase/dehydratase family protein [Clostridium sp.]MDY2630706.1 NAD-dependent epimerase/dehydratase family protein [Clostridium sp.]
MKIIITGVYGIVGSYLCNKLKNTHEIIGIGKRQSWAGCHKYYSCDISNKEGIKRIFNENKDVEVIIHCAAIAHNKGNDLSRDNFMKVNYEATKYLIELSNEILELKNFIFVSTISVYGERLDKDIYRESDSCEPKSPYAVAKKLSEDYIIENCKSNYTILRLAPVYSKDFTLNIERRTKIKGIPYVVGNGKQKLSLCNIKNIYKSINYIIDNAEREINEIYNISDNTVYEFKDLLNFVDVKRKILFPKFAFKVLYIINSRTVKKQFIHENTIKLISDNIYSCKKINIKIKMKYGIKDVI